MIEDPTESEVKVLHVELALSSFTGVFDNELTQQREWWLRGQRGAVEPRGAGHTEVGRWCEPNPDQNIPELDVEDVIARINRRANPHKNSELD